MSVVSQKKQIFGQIAAAKTLTEGMPKLNTTSSFPSVNNNGNTISFLTDLIKSLIGYQKLQETINDTLVYSLHEIEKDIKIALKSELKSIVNCGTNPSLPYFIKSTGDGININVNQIDFTGLMLINPNSSAGKLLYNDLKSDLIKSTDFNTFLYQTIQNDGTPESWGSQTTQSNILTFEFSSSDIARKKPNNTLNIKADSSYDNKSLTDLNNNFIDSITLFNTENILTNVIDSIFGTVSSAAGKSLSQLENQAKTNTVIKKIANSNSNDIINNSYFKFNNVENAAHQAEAISKSNGTKSIVTTSTIKTSLSLQSVTNMNTSISSAKSTAQKNTALTSSLNGFSNQLSSPSKNPADNHAIGLNFIQEIINNLINVITNIILSPKVITLFALNFKIIYGPDAVYTDAIDFMKKNKNLIQSITKSISNAVINVLLKLALKEIENLVSKAVIKKIFEKGQNNQAQLLSLLGIPPNATRQIKKLL